MNTIQTLKGFRDFLPEEKRKRDYVSKKIIEIFELFGFEPFATPTLEYSELLLGKYGEESDKLVYTFEDRGKRKVGLRYDQTVPTARVLAQYQNKLPRHFRRYQIQNVFRAEKPQKGRYREFTQCDIDIFGSSHPVADAELLACTYAAYKNIGFNNIKFKLNSREDIKRATHIFDTYPLEDKEGKISGEIWNKQVNSFMQSVDKIDKIGKDAVCNELREKGFKDHEIQLVNQLIKQRNEKYMSEELTEIVRLAVLLGVNETCFEYDPLMVRGLDYYTGMIFEVSMPELSTGSVGGGGRYDNLIKSLGGPDLPAVGMAFGFDRTVEAADQLGLLASSHSVVQVFVAVFDQTGNESISAAKTLRASGIRTELSTYLYKPKTDEDLIVDIEMKRDDKTFGKLLANQLKIADSKGIPYVLIIGPDEAARNEVTLKDLSNKTQETMTIEEVIQKLTQDQ